MSRINDPINRRAFFKQTGGGIAILFTLGAPGAEAQRRSGPEYPEDFNAYLRIGADGCVSCYTGKIEMGQGIITSLAQMLAEELDVRLDAVDMVMGDTFLCPYDSGTTGSRSTKYFGPPLRRAAAEAKKILHHLAAERLDAPVEDLVAREGVISVKDDNGRSISYGRLARGARIERHIKEVAPKHYSEHTLSGRAVFRTDSHAKVTGKAQFTGDVRVPGMLYARVLRPPAHGASLKSVDLGRAREVPGVIVVHEDDLIAVLHELPDMADRALTEIKAGYDIPKREPRNDTVFTHLENSVPEQRIVSQNGEVGAAKAGSSKIIRSTFYNHYVAHAPMETHTVLVDVRDDEVCVWSATQTPFRVQSLVAETLDVPVETVHVETPFLGGGFGGKKTGRLISDAARLAKITSRPVQIEWRRGEEFFYDTFRPAAVIKAESGLDESGRIVCWEFAHLFSGTRSSEPIYDIPHFRVTSQGGGWGGDSVHPFATGAWRGPGSNTNVFAMESQTDKMAEAAGMDPLSFRLANLSDERMIRALKAAADRFGRTFTRAPSGKGYGIACTNYLNTYVVSMAEVKVNGETGTVTVERIVCAHDMGEIINPQGAVIQIEGGLIMGLGYCLAEEIKFQGGAILDENFDTYEIPRFSWVPRIEVELIENPELAPQGCGEPAITTMGAVLANAVYDSVGARLYTLPMTPARIKSALRTG